MTVGIGLLCNQGKNILLGADMRASYGPVTQNDQTGKLFDLPFAFCGAVAGTISQCEDVISELYHRMEKIPQSDVCSTLVVNAIRDSYEQIYVEMADECLWNALKIRVEEYKHDTKLVQSLRDKAETVLKSVEIDVDLIVAGFVKDGPVHLVTEGGTGIRTASAVTPGNAVIGSGSIAALNWLNYRKQNNTLGLARSFLHLTEAKQFSETERTVGHIRQCILLWPGGFKPLEGGQQLIQDWWNRYGLMDSAGLSDPSYEEKFTKEFGLI